jgi:hypothetical protein
MMDLVPAYRCGAVPDSHGIPSFDGILTNPATRHEPHPIALSMARQSTYCGYCGFVRILAEAKFHSGTPHPTDRRQTPMMKVEF